MFDTSLLLDHFKIHADRIPAAVDIDGRRIVQRRARANLPFPRDDSVAVGLFCAESVGGRHAGFILDFAVVFRVWRALNLDIRVASAADRVRIVEYRDTD